MKEQLTVHISGATRAGVAGKVPDTLLHEYRLREPSQEVPRLEPHEAAFLRGMRYCIHCNHVLQSTLCTPEYTVYSRVHCVHCALYSLNSCNGFPFIFTER